MWSPNETLRRWIPAGPLFAGSIVSTLSLLCLFDVQPALWLMGVSKFKSPPEAWEVATLVAVNLVVLAVGAFVFTVALMALRDRVWAKWIAGMMLPFFLWGGFWCFKEARSAGLAGAGLAFVGLALSGFLIFVWSILTFWCLISRPRASATEAGDR
jgi:hypothetical protein